MEGSIIILSNVSKSLYDAYSKDPSEDYTVELVEAKKSRDQLLKEREELMQKIAEIDHLLAE